MSAEISDETRLEGTWSKNVKKSETAEDDTANFFADIIKFLKLPSEELEVCPFFCILSVAAPGLHAAWLSFVTVSRKSQHTIRTSPVPNSQTTGNERIG